MNELTAILQRHAINTASLRPVFGEDDQRLYSLVVPGPEVNRLWYALRDLVAETGRWPIILGNEGEKEKTIEVASSYAATVTSTLLAGSNLEATSWFSRRLAEYREFAPLDSKDWLGEWLEDLANDISYPFPYSREEGSPAIYVGLLPTSISWHALAYLHYGGWNECPLPEVHVCITKRWFEKYGAEIVTVLPDSLIMRVTRPPTDRGSALSLAWEHYLYCPDSVDQGAGSLKELASGLLNEEIWAFWWD